MTDPKIRYDVQAVATGEADIAALAAQLGKLDEALDPQAAARAKAFAAELEVLGGKRSAVQSFGKALVDANEAGRRLEQTSTELQRLERSLQAVVTPTRTQAGQLQKLRDAAAAAQVAFQSKTETLNTSRGALDKYSISANNLDGAEDRLTASMRTTAGEAQKLVVAYQQTATAATNAGRAQDQYRAQLDGLLGQLRAVQGVAAAAIGGGLLGGLAGDISATADQYANLAARIRLVTGEGQAFNEAFDGVFEVAKRTNSSVEETGTLFARLAEAGKALGVSQREALGLTETINQAIQLSGGSAEASKAAITQLIQGLQSGVLRGEEFNSVIEQSPRLAQALADGLGVARGELRELAGQGRLTSEAVIQSLAGQSSAVQREFDQLPLTVGRALQNLSTEWTRYVGQVDQANGASAAAAKTIEALASNLKTVANLLLDVGQGAAAFAALRLAQTFLGLSQATVQATVAKQAETLATTQNTAAKGVNTAAAVVNTGAKVGNTAAVVGNSAAQAQNTAATTVNSASKLANATAAQASAAATTASAAAAGRLASIVSTIKTFALLTVLTNIKDIGTAAGEGIAKLQGWGKAMERNEQQARADAEASRVSAAQKAELAEKARKAADAMFGLTKESKGIVAEFEEMSRKGDTVSESLAKITKSLKLGDLKGITDATAALDALERKGKITGEQVRESLAAGLKGVDLLEFKTNATAAFDSSEQGARRLQAVLDAIGLESLSRAGLSVQELRTGFSAAATSAINDVDELARTLKALGADSNTTGRALAGALDKATVAASTESAVRAVISRFTELGQQGRIAGDALEQGLEKARKKLDELKPGITSLGEALRAFGIKTREELQNTADKLGAAYRVVANDVTVSLADKARAFMQYRDAAVAANGGVETSEISLQRRILENRMAAADLGKTIVDSMSAAGQAVDQTGRKIENSTNSMSDWERQIERLRNGPLLGGIGPSQDGKNFGVRSAGGPENKVNGLTPIDSFNRLYNATPDRGITRTGPGQLTPPDNSGDWFLDTSRRGEGPFGLGVWTLTPESAQRRYQEFTAQQAALGLSFDGVGWRPGAGTNPTGAAGASPFGPRGGAAAGGPGSTFETASGGRGRNLESGGVQIVFNFGTNRSHTVFADSISAAEALMRDLERQYQLTGGP